ncbi:MAG: ABC transporter permease [Acidobacteriota bacterium]
MSALERKLARDLWRLKGQVVTIALVLACGIWSMIMMRSTWQSLVAARDTYYEQYRFSDVFAHLERAPDTEVARLAQLPGVAVVAPRLVENVMVPMPDEPDPVTGRIVSIPDTGEPPLDAIYLRAGRLPAPGVPDEALVIEHFATAYALHPGDHIPVVMNGRLRSIEVVGIALSPEYVLAMSGFEMVPDNRRFVVLWMRRGVVAPAFSMDGAFDDVTFRLQPGADTNAVLDAVDRELARYGGRHALARAKQLSNYQLEGELGVLRTLAIIIPAMFLAVAAFLVNVIVGRLVFLERTQIAVLKALGFGNRRIGVHYLVLVAMVVAIGAALGVVLGVRMGGWMSGVYEDFYRFPTKLYHVEPSAIVVSIAIGLVAAVGGALGSARRVVRMPPAQAMRPPAPLVYRRSLLERLGLARLLGPSAMIVTREITRKPIRFALSTLGIAMGVAMFIMGNFSYDSFDHLMHDVFPREHQEDVVVMFERAVPARALHELEHVPGVELAEGARTVPIRIHHGERWRDIAITGLPADGALRHLLDHGTTPIALPETGLVLTDKLAEILGVRVGDAVDVDLLEGDYSSRSLLVAGVVDEAFGLQAYARADWLASVLREEPRASMALLRVDATRGDALRARLKQLPKVLGVTTTQRIVERYRQQMGEMILVITLILALSAAAISIGVVYNNARIAVSLRGRDLASLRVLGFTRREISAMLLGELGAQVVVGIPLGLVLGTYLAKLLAASIDPEQVRFPLAVDPKTYATAAIIALVSGLVSALLVRRQLDHLDLVSVLKSSE